jgi:ribosomal protein S16
VPTVIQSLEYRVVVTNDADFRDGHLITGYFDPPSSSSTDDPTIDQSTVLRSRR